MSTPGAATAFLGGTASAQSAQQTNGHSTQGEEMIAVPAGLWGSLIGSLGKVVGTTVGGKAGQVISGVGQTVEQFSPFSAVPGAQSQQQEELIAVPAGLWGSIVGSLGKVVGGAVGGKAGHAISGAADIVQQFSPFSTLPPQQGQQEEMIAVPAGLWGSLIGSLGKVVGGAVGGTAGKVISGAGETVERFAPFSVVR